MEGLTTGRTASSRGGGVGTQVFLLLSEQGSRITGESEGEHKKVTGNFLTVARQREKKGGLLVKMGHSGGRDEGKGLPGEAGDAAVIVR